MIGSANQVESSQVQGGDRVLTCHNKENSVSTVYRGSSIKRAGSKKFYVVTQDIPIATRTRLLQ